MFIFTRLYRPVRLGLFILIFRFFGMMRLMTFRFVRHCFMVTVTEFFMVSLAMIVWNSSNSSWSRANNSWRLTIGCHHFKSFSCHWRNFKNVKVSKAFFIKKIKCWLQIYLTMEDLMSPREARKKRGLRIVVLIQEHKRSSSVNRQTAH